MATHWSWGMAGVRSAADGPGVDPEQVRADDWRSRVVQPLDRPNHVPDEQHGLQHAGHAPRRHATCSARLCAGSVSASPTAGLPTLLLAVSTESSFFSDGGCHIASGCLCARLYCVRIMGAVGSCGDWMAQIAFQMNGLLHAGHGASQAWTTAWFYRMSATVTTY